MKNVKKRLIAVFMLSAMLFLLVGCGGETKEESPYAGTWTATTAEYSGFEMEASSILGGDMVFVLDSNGKCEMTIVDETEKGKWKESENGFIVEDEFEFVVNDDKTAAELEYDGVTIKFQHEGAAAATGSAG